MSAHQLQAVELKAFVPAKNFELSKRFYADLGFTQRSEGGGVAYFVVDGCPFLLQDFDDRALSRRLVMNTFTRHEKTAPATPIRQHLAQKRAAKALVRRTGWLGSGNRWMAFAVEGCACGCEEPEQRRARR